jgi:hypothetical protein
MDRSGKLSMLPVGRSNFNCIKMPRYSNLFEDENRSPSHFENKLIEIILV